MLTHKGTQTIKTQRLILRRFSLSDASDMFNNWAGDERVTRWLTWSPHSSEAATADLLELWCAEYAKADKYNWAIEYEDRAIGNISVVRHHERVQWAELGYCMGAGFWGRGIMTEAVKAVTDFLFDEVGFNRIQISHVDRNPASGAVALKCGFRFEGTRRQYALSRNGEFLDVCEYGLLKSDRADQNQKTHE